MTLTEDRSAAAVARQAMIVSQLRTSGVNEPWVLEAMAGVAREDFVPAGMRDAAYIDRAITLDNGRQLAAPVVHGKMLAEAEPTKTDKALLVGDANGYLAALLRPLVGSLEVVDPAAAKDVAKGDYTLLVIDGAVEELPETLTAALAEGGRAVTGLVVRGVPRLATGIKAAGTLALLPLAEIGIPVLPEFAAPKRWSF
ncbi:protein-L-isoaspartate(D-aspartate) O-methyltransferase [Novosphingobium sp. PhB165]|uniref:protein-L-isoaspartate O-methyltransferase family protein n=1 Tax=Novosphingobium sp. PhB165 TaxID=2485105 RepID=UPI00104AC6E5|nr:protein-L-isoaspartate O-methyltransferase [Novosphingobium sp. PhB165]TCM18561.1 protein-L-isoaspartate(D-aspartate) O-methyltransferase [Novosphingobium sp. PhB165]